MRTIQQITVCGAFLGAMGLATSAHAQLQQSKKEPLSLSGGIGFANATYQGPFGFGASQGTFRFPSFDISYHFDGRSDGFNIGGRQELWFNNVVVGMTAFRIGYDFAIPAGKYEVTVAPFGLVGPSYGSGNVHFSMGTGVEGRFYPMDNGFFAYGRPIEFIGHVGDGGYWTYQFAVGAGISL